MVELLTQAEKKFLSHKTYRFLILYLPSQGLPGSWSEDKFFMLLLFRKLQWWEKNRQS